MSSQPETKPLPSPDFAGLRDTLMEAEYQGSPTIPWSFNTAYQLLSIAEENGRLREKADRDYSILHREYNRQVDRAEKAEAEAAELRTLNETLRGQLDTFLAGQTAAVAEAAALRAVVEQVAQLSERGGEQGPLVQAARSALSPRAEGRPVAAMTEAEAAMREACAAFLSLRRSVLENVRHEIWKEVAYAFDLALEGSRTASQAHGEASQREAPAKPTEPKGNQMFNQSPEGGETAVKRLTRFVNGEKLAGVWSRPVPHDRLRDDIATLLPPQPPTAGEGLSREAVARAIADVKIGKVSLLTVLTIGLRELDFNDWFAADKLLVQPAAEAVLALSPSPTAGPSRGTPE